MNCAQCQENLVAHIEGLLEVQQERELAAHLQECPTCQAESAGWSGLRDRLIASGTNLGQGSVEAPVMARIAQERTINSRRIAMRKRYGKTGVGLAAAAAVAAALLVGWPGTTDRQASAAEVLAWAIEALSDLHSVHIQANIRTLERDNFELIGLEFPFVAHDLWKTFGDTPQWRIEKPGRVVVMDGDSSLLFIRPNQAAKGGVDTGFVGWLKPLLDVQQVLDSELRLAQEQGSELLLTHEEGETNSAKLVVSIEAKAQGDFTNDWCKNKSITASDNRRVYRFDAETKMLEDLSVWVHGDVKDVLVLEITEINYNADVDPGLFSLALPRDVIWFTRPKPLEDNQKYSAMTPDEAARAFFQAFADEDWDEVLKFWTASSIGQRTKDYLAGLEIISIGEPFRSGRFPGWFVPYEIKLRSGEVRTMNLAVRRDNAADRYVVDGGI